MGPYRAVGALSGPAGSERLFRLGAAEVIDHLLHLLGAIAGADEEGVLGLDDEEVLDPEEGDRLLPRTRRADDDGAARLEEGGPLLADVSVEVATIGARIGLHLELRLP